MWLEKLLDATPRLFFPPANSVSLPENPFSFSPCPHPFTSILAPTFAAMRFLLPALLAITFALPVQAQTRPDTLVFPEIPSNERLVPSLLAPRLCENLKNDEERAYALFYWMTHQIRWDVRAFNKAEEVKYKTPEQVLSSKTGNAGEFAHLYKALCEAVGIRAQVVPGYLRDELYNDGMSFYEPNHVWNAVLLSHRWQLVDVFQGAGGTYMDLNTLKRLMQKINKKKLYFSTKARFRPGYNSDWFAPDPETFRLNAIPADPIWQLTDTLMPLSVFERSEEDIRQFNERYSQLRQSYGLLSEVNRMDEDQAILETADRTYAFNPRFTGMETARHAALCKTLVDSLSRTRDRAEADRLLAQAKKEINTSKDLVQEEKQQLSREYSELRKNNMEKRTDVVKFRQTFSRINSKYIAEAGSKLNTADSKSKTLQEDAKNRASRADELKPGTWEKLRGAQPPVAADAPEMQRLQDSLKTRKPRYEAAQDRILKRKVQLSEEKAEQERVQEQLAYYIIRADSTLNAEALARSRRKDSYSDSIRMLRSELHFYKATMVDSLQQRWFDLYDSVLLRYDALKKDYQECLDLTRGGVRDGLAMGRLNKELPGLRTGTEAMAELYRESVRGYVNNHLSTINFLQKQKPLIKSLKKVYESENAFFERMVSYEDDRKEQVQEIISKNEKLDLKRNEHRKEQIATMKANLDKGFLQATKPQKKKRKS